MMQLVLLINKKHRHLPPYPNLFGQVQGAQISVKG